MGSANRFRPVVDGGVTLAAGFSAGAVYAGIKTPGPDKLDLAILVSDRPAAVAGIFTRNAFCAAPVTVSRERVAARRARAVIANAGNANACTGEQGLADAREMAALAARHRLPAVYAYRFFADSGGLLSYGSDLLDNFRRAAIYADRILKGEKPSELPVQAPEKFELVINLKAAKALGLDVSPSLLARAHEVIE